MTAPTPGLTIEIDRKQQLPIYLQICERFRTAIAAGHLRPGDRVPALRGLATQLNTARGTVELAYTILVDEGYLQMRGAAGTFVSPSLPASLTRSPRAQGDRDARGGQRSEEAGASRTRGESRDAQAAARQLALTVAMSGEPRPCNRGCRRSMHFPPKCGTGSSRSARAAANARCSPIPTRSATGRCASISPLISACRTV
jgi:GntR family transcriptional regulator/MocR family aminotransferase